MLITTGIAYEIRNDLTIYAILCSSLTIFYRQELVCFFKCIKNRKRAGIQSENFRVE